MTMSRLLICLLTIVLMVFQAGALDFGLKFKSHSFPSDQRTSLKIGDADFAFNKDFTLGFDFSFYSESMFGNLASITTDDDQCISVLASRLDDGQFYLGMVINDKLYILNIPLSLSPEKPEHVELQLSRSHNTAKLSFNDSEIEHPVDLSATSRASFFFGMGQENKQAVVAPFELRRVTVTVDQRNTNRWDLKFHDTDSTSIDDIGGLKATVANPHWLIDDHADWQMIYSDVMTQRVQTAFDPATETFYIVTDSAVTKFEPLTGKQTDITVRAGKRILPYSNHLVFDPSTGGLTNYNLNRKSLSRFSLTDKKWISLDGGDFNDEANYANHAVAISGDTLYAFGGYGFYKYHNDFFIINLRNGEIRKQFLSPELMPMTSSAAAIVDDTLYIFGGKGNPTGRQELPVRYNYALFAYDTSTWEGKKVWELDSVKVDMIPSQSMYYNDNDDCFYLAATTEGGLLAKISRSKPHMQALSTPIRAKMDYHDFVFDLYRSTDGLRYYLLLDKRLNPQTHDYSIYTISAPFLDNQAIIDNKSPQSQNEADTPRPLLGWLLAAIVLIFVIMVATAITVRRKRSAQVTEQTSTASEADEPAIFNVAHPQATPATFQRDKAAISLLGRFNVRDCQGNDITDKFTTKLKNLLLLLILCCQKSKNGITYQIINEEIWHDKDEKSAQNNRNVTMRKLRKLLEEVGDISISYDKGLFKISTGNVMVDYSEITARITSINDMETVPTETINQIIELLLMGPLLPATNYDWLDPYKAEYTDKALSILTRILRHEFGRNDELAYRIAQTMSLHEPLSEEALIAKCRILCKRKTITMARSVYDSFIREYRRSLGEEFPTPFPEICKKEI